MELRDLISSNPETLSGTPVFKGTRVPVSSLFAHLEQGYSVDGFIEEFPSVPKEQAYQLLKMLNRLFLSDNLDRLYEAAA
jgi:uncharacterized protein (DUF433 family)